MASNLAIAETVLFVATIGAVPPSGRSHVEM
jgi:hypothetical protein